MLVHQQLFNLSDRERWFRADSQRSFSESVDIRVTNGILDLTSEGFFERYREAIVDEFLKGLNFSKMFSKSLITLIKTSNYCCNIPLIMLVYLNVFNYFIIKCFCMARVNNRFSIILVTI